eukprot:SAG11_NODE_9476_length_908_cov_1.000000_2_plen_28_part_01
MEFKKFITDTVVEGGRVLRAHFKKFPQT